MSMRFPVQSKTEICLLLKSDSWVRFVISLFAFSEAWLRPFVVVCTL
jgi:hypothetical protein